MTRRQSTLASDFAISLAFFTTRPKLRNLSRCSCALSELRASSRGAAFASEAGVGRRSARRPDPAPPNGDAHDPRGGWVCKHPVADRRASARGTRRATWKLRWRVRPNLPREGLTRRSKTSSIRVSASGERLDNDPSGARYGCFLPDLTGLARRSPAPTSRELLYARCTPDSTAHAAETRHGSVMHFLCVAA